MCTTYFFFAKVVITFNYTVETIAIKNRSVFFLHNPENSEFFEEENFGCLSTHLRNKLPREFIQNILVGMFSI